MATKIERELAVRLVRQPRTGRKERGKPCIQCVDSTRRPQGKNAISPLLEPDFTPISSRFRPILPVPCRLQSDCGEIAVFSNFRTREIRG